jgi:hypothetical protein
MQIENNGIEKIAFAFLYSLGAAGNGNRVIPVFR